MIGLKNIQQDIHRTEKEFIRIVDELKKQEDIEIKQDGQIIGALRAHTEGNQQLNKQMGRLIRSTTILAVTQIVLIVISIAVGAYVAIKF